MVYNPLAIQEVNRNLGMEDQALGSNHRCSLVAVGGTDDHPKDLSILSAVEEAVVHETPCLVG